MHFIFGLFLELNKSCVEYWLNPYWYKLFHTPSLLLRLWIKYLGLVPGVLLANTSYSIAEMQVAWNFLWKGNENFEHCFRFDHRTYENAGSADFAFKAYQSLSMANTAWLSLYACFLIRETENTYQVFFFYIRNLWYTEAQWGHEMKIFPDVPLIIFGIPQSLICLVEVILVRLKWKKKYYWSENIQYDLHYCAWMPSRYMTNTHII